MSYAFWLKTNNFVDNQKHKEEDSSTFFLILYQFSFYFACFIEPFLVTEIFTVLNILEVLSKSAKVIILMKLNLS